MCAAMPIMVTASGAFSLGPAVDWLQLSNEQTCPARSAKAFFVLEGKSSRLFAIAKKYADP
jgi:hypothetical protein